MVDVVALGEAMIRLTPTRYQRLEQTGEFLATVGGSELNSAIGVMRLGLTTAWVSKLVNNPLGRMIANKAREHGVDVSHVVWTKQGRTGLYFFEQGATPRASQVIYDRAGSAASTLAPGEVDWSFLEGCRLFHTSGITPALSESCAAATIEAIQKAKDAGCAVSFDVNYRARLWSPEEARACLEKMMPSVDILITTEDDAGIVFGKSGTPEEICKQLTSAFGFSVVTITLREVRTVLTGGWTSMAFADRVYTDRKYEVEMIDRIGAGDAYTAGFLYGYLTGDVDKAVKYGNANAALVQTVPGDFSWFTREEIEAQLKGPTAKVQR